MLRKTLISRKTRQGILISRQMLLNRTLVRWPAVEAALSPFAGLPSPLEPRIRAGSTIRVSLFSGTIALKAWRLIQARLHKPGQLCVCVWGSWRKERHHLSIAFTRRQGEKFHSGRDTA